MKQQTRVVDRLSIRYRTGRKNTGDARRVICTINVPRHVSRAEVELADALISLIERRPSETLVDA